VRTRPISIVILYTHPLLGMGLGKLLAAEPGLEITSVSTQVAGQAEAALAGDPDVVIVERGVPVETIDLLKVAPNALVIDVGMDAGPSWSWHREQIPARPDGLVRAIRRLRRAERCVAPPGVLGARP